jgi:hypothetical protein
MSNKFKPRQQKKPRSLVNKDMILTRKGGPMRDRRDRKPLEQKREWQKEYDSLPADER